MTGQPSLNHAADDHVLEALCVSLVKDPPKTEKKLRQQLKQYTKPNGDLFGKAEIIKALRDDFPLPEQESHFWQNATAILKKPTRSLSGVTPVTVLTKPHPCPGRCVFCPNDVRMPKSYLFNEPGSRRAWENGFDPYRQVMTRLYSYWQHGHATEKIELIILGGTFTFYPPHYQRYFIGRCFAAMNDFANIPKDETLDLIKTPSVPKITQDPTAIQRRGKYNSLVKQAFATESFEEEQWSTWTLEKIQKHHKDNEESLTKCIGLVVETRPEEITTDNLTFLRAMGCTKIQIGLQSNNDDILKKNKRGHLAEDNKKACDLLRQFGFKIHGHVMVNLWGATPSNDYDDFLSFFQEPRLKPDELKIYPCMLVEDTELHVAYENKEWQPYPQDILETLLKKMLLSVPLWCRISRMIRDFSKDDIVAGNKKANLRQHLQKELKSQNKVVQEIRSREVRQMHQPGFKPIVTQHAYATGIGEDIFLQICDAKDQIYGYLRLTLPQKEAPLHELKDAAIIRELHIYGKSLPLKGPSLPGSQHRGYGTLLLQQAAKISLEAGFNKLCVISGIGTRSYYRKKGFSDGKLYQYQHLNKEAQT